MPDRNMRLALDAASRIDRRIYAACVLRRVMAVVAIVIGTVVIGFDPNRGDAVVLTLPRDHGIHLTDVVGMTLVTVGITVLWSSPRSERPAEE